MTVAPALPTTLRLQPADPSTTVAVLLEQTGPEAFRVSTMEGDYRGTIRRWEDDLGGWRWQAVRSGDFMESTTRAGAIRALF